MLSLLLVSAMLSAWGPSGCPPVGGFVSSFQSYEWRTREDDPGRYYLFRNGVQIAGYDERNGDYRDYDAATNQWGEKRTPPWVKEVKIESMQNFGVDLTKLRKDERCTINGREVTLGEAQKAISDSRVPDDANKLRLTVIGRANDTKRVIDDISSNPALRELASRCVVQSYEPTSWAVSQSGFVTSGSPTIYLQAPSGKVLHRQDTYTGPDQLAQAIRKADPGYDPKKDPDLNKPFNIPGLPDLTKLPPWAWVVAVLAILMLLRRPS